VRLLGLLLLALALVAWSVPAEASDLDKGELRKVTIEQKIGETVSLDLRFSERGSEAPLSHWFEGRPIVLALVYNRCPMLCSQVLQGVLGSLRALELEPGTDFDFLAVSFDPDEDPATTSDARSTFLRRLAKPGAEKAVHFLNGTAEPIAALTDAVGFHYEYDTTLGQYAHPSAIIVLTPEGKVARYFFGTEYSPRDLRFALHEASDGKVGSVTDDLLMLCYRYDPATGTYSASVMTAIRAGGVLTVLGLALFMARNLRRDRRRAKAPPTGGAGPAGEGAVAP
jgi:protein SCO1/2